MGQRKDLVKVMAFFCFVVGVMIVSDMLRPMRKISITHSVNNHPFWDRTTLIDLHDFKYVTFNQVCNDSTSLDLLVYIHSSAGNFEKRRAIRNTWGKSQPKMRIVFMLGSVKDKILQDRITQENRDYQDIIQGSFMDAYKNMTYKHVMGLKYAVFDCSSAKYVLKTDDDVYVNMESLLIFLDKFGTVSRMKEAIICTIRAKTKVYRKNYKWAVSTQEYANSHFPTYCLGPAIIYSFEAAYHLYSVLQLINYFWIDDVHVTGTAAEMAEIDRSDLSVSFLSGSTLTKIIDSNGTDGPALFFFAYEVSPEKIYALNKALMNRRRLL